MERVHTRATLARAVAMKHACLAREAGQLGDFDEADKHLAVVKWCRGVFRQTVGKNETGLRGRMIGWS